jgi:lipopolysaccharide export system permease protein
MLFKRALRRELSSLAGVVFATLFTILITTTLIRWLGRAASGRVDTESILPLMAFSAIGSLPVLLVLTVYVAVLMALTRAWRDSEMVIWFASGRSLLQWIAPVIGFALPAAALCGFVSFVAAPWSSQQAYEYEQRFAQREDISRVAAGQFRESAGGGRVFYVESLNDLATEVQNIFVTQRSAERESIVVAQSGRIETRPDGDRYLVLERGRRYDSKPGSSEMSVMAFERYGLLIEPQLGGPVTGSGIRARSVSELLAEPNPRHLAELHWRLSLPLSAILMALLAIPLSAVNPRLGRSTNLIVALLAYLVYNNLLSVMRAWIAQERIDFVVGASAVHLGLLLVIVLLFWRRLTLSGGRPWWRRAVGLGRAPAMASADTGGLRG